jgi:hypothetical protein
VTTATSFRRTPGVRERAAPAVPQASMTNPRRYLVRQVLFVIAVLAAALALYATGPLEDAFLANPLLNSFILFVLLLGVFYSLRLVQRLQTEVRWIEAYRRQELAPRHAPVLLAPMATLLGDENRRISLSTLSMTSILDSISSRLDESREISRYMTGLMIFLGLLGTFWGLIETITAVGRTVGSLSMTGDAMTLFGDLIIGLTAPLRGMGTSFSASLFGLSGALVLGFLDLQTGQAQNRFYNDLEEWLSSFTRLSSGGIAGTDQSVPAYVSALLEQTAESLDTLQRTIARGEDSRASSNTALLALSDRLATLNDSMRAEQDLMVKLAEAQLEVRPVLRRLADALDQNRQVSLDETSRAHLRNLDVYVMRMLEESAAGRQQIVEEFRSEIKLLARTLATLNSPRRIGERGE